MSRFPGRIALFAPALACLLPCSVTAGIVIDVTGVAGSGTTTWTFSGSATPGGPITIDDNDANFSSSWLVDTGFFLDTTLGIDFTSTTATFTVGDDQYAIEGIGAGRSAPLVSFGIAIERMNDPMPPQNYQFNSTTPLTEFSGSGIAAVDITRFRAGITEATLWDGQSLPVTFNVAGDTVPEPSTVASLAVLGFGLLMRGRRHSKN